MQDRESVDAIYVDFSRAFDSVVHRKWLLKLESFGIHGLLLLWIAAFLANRLQCVVVENSQSDWMPVISGVPQGSVLGPVLFILFINDVCGSCNNDVSFSLFADDLKLYSTVHTGDQNSPLQQALNKLVDRADKWQLPININKTSVFHIGVSNVKTQYYYKGEPLYDCDTIRDLGVTTDTRLLYDSHIQNIVRQAYMRIGVLFKGFVSRDITLLRMAYITFIRPLVEYASNVWCPYKLKHVRAIEKIQRHFTRRIPMFRDYSYEERLARLNLETLELRRLRFDLVLYYKMFNDLGSFDVNCYFEFPTRTRQTRSDGGKPLPKIRGKTKVLENHFFQRRIECWNSLPEFVRSATSVKQFKENLTKVDLAEFLVVKF